MTVDDMIESILEKEGGFQKWTADSGNYLNGKLIGTNKGIIPSQLARYRGVRTVTEQDMRELTDEEAAAIYKQFYYDDNKLELLPDFLEPAVFDFTVNSGPGNSIRALQRTLCAFGYECDVDGALGPQTMRVAFKAAAEVPEDVLLKAYLQERRAFLHRIVDNRPSQAVFLKGWMNRVDNLERELLA